MEHLLFCNKCSIFHNIFKCMIFQRRKKALLWSKWLKSIVVDSWNWIKDLNKVTDKKSELTRDDPKVLIVTL